MLPLGRLAVDDKGTVGQRRKSVTSSTKTKRCALGPAWAPRPGRPRTAAAAVRGRDGACAGWCVPTSRTREAELAALADNAQVAPSGVVPGQPETRSTTARSSPRLRLVAGTSSVSGPAHGANA